mmetsp:Transcript_21419/g.31793  ORF Transcript_21419/g.31793 Transcript_21419/m.31793 type:complete len:216 (-) Transcript_21419:607-1254(-)
MKFAATSLAAVVLLGLHGTSAQDDCVPCDDKPTPIMEDKGKKCDDFPNVIESKCSGADNWVENKFCRYTCSMNGRGYRDEEECCANGPATAIIPPIAAEEVEPKEVLVAPLPTTTEGEENTSTPTNIPPIAVSDEPASNGDGTEEAGEEENEVDCTPCDDKPTPIMIERERSALTSLQLSRRVVMMPIIGSTTSSAARRALKTEGVTREMIAVML